jgi:hypothetical protein
LSLSGRNRFDRIEWAGAFGDLGTLLPFVIAYGLYCRTPFPIQPMKAIGAVAATQAAQTAVITSSDRSSSLPLSGRCGLPSRTQAQKRAIAYLRGFRLLPNRMNWPISPQI